MKPDLLVAEGDIELCRIFQRFLTKQGYQVATAVDGLECLEKLRQAAPAVLILDRELCWGGGDGVLAWLREENAALDVRVILTDTVGYGPEGAPAVQAPVVQFLPKPFALTALLESVRDAVTHRESTQRIDRPRIDGSEYYLG